MASYGRADCNGRVAPDPVVSSPRNSVVAVVSKCEATTTDFIEGGSHCGCGGRVNVGCYYCCVHGHVHGRGRGRRDRGRRLSCTPPCVGGRGRGVNGGGFCI